MVRVTNDFDFGDVDNIEDLKITLRRMYFELASAINSKPDLYQRETNGQASDTILAQGSININTSTNRVEMLTTHTSPTNVIWTTLS